MKELNCANGSVVKAKKELAQVGLLKETRQGMNKPNRLYITGYSKTEFQGVQKLDVGHSKTEFQDIQKLDGINTNNINTNISILSNQQQDEVDEIRKSYDMFFEAFPKQRKNAFTQQDILADINEFGNELYQYALKLAMTNEANYPSYIEKIFTSWRNEGITTLEQAKEKQSKHSNSKLDKDFIGFGIQGSGY